MPTLGGKAMNYRQLEEQINKWMLELEAQERVFLQQATQVNAWDRLLVDNGEKVGRIDNTYPSACHIRVLVYTVMCLITGTGKYNQFF